MYIYGLNIYIHTKHALSSRERGDPPKSTSRADVKGKTEKEENPKKPSQSSKTDIKDAIPPSKEDKGCVPYLWGDPQI